jgi:hypothetical protein
MTDVSQDEFSIMLRAFNGIVEKKPSAEKVKGELLELKEQASISNELNIRQKEAIMDRVDNYLNGNYGNTKVDSNFGHGKASLNGVAKG